MKNVRGRRNCFSPVWINGYHLAWVCNNPRILQEDDLRLPITTLLPWRWQNYDEWEWYILADSCHSCLCATLYMVLGLAWGQLWATTRIILKTCGKQSLFYVKMNPPHGDSSLTSPHFLWESRVVWDGGEKPYVLNLPKG